MKTYAAYIRVSTVKQGDKGSSLQEQKAAIEAYAARNNLKISAWYEEQETAAKSGRPVFSSLVKALERGAIAGVITHKIDRSARNLKDWAQLGDLIDSGIELHFAHESLDLSSRGGRLAADIQAVVAADYIRNLRDEVKKGFYGRLKQGLYPLQAPLGYQDNGGGKPKTVDPVAGPLVRQAFDLYATGDWSLHTLRDELDARGLRNRQGHRVTLNGLSTLLNNPFYAGIIRIRKTGEHYPGVHEPLIDPTTFRAAKAILEGRQPHKATTHRYRYQRMIICASCGRSLIAECQKSHVYYRCHTRECPPTSLREERIDAAIQASCLRFWFSPAEWNVIERDVKGLIEVTEQEAGDRDRALHLAYSAATDRLDRLTDAYLDQTIDRQTYLERKERLLLDHASIKARIEAAQNVRAQIERLFGEILELVRRLGCLFDSPSDEEIRAALKEAASNLSLDGKSLAVAWRNPLAAIGNLPVVLSGEPHRGKPRTAEDLKELTKLIADHVATRPLHPD